jgi:hypothetical protein
MNKEQAVCGQCGTMSGECVTYAYCPTCEKERGQKKKWADELMPLAQAYVSARKDWAEKDRVAASAGFDPDAQELADKAYTKFVEAERKLLNRHRELVKEYEG